MITDRKTNELIESLPLNVFNPNDKWHNQAIPLDERRKVEWVDYNLYSAEFAEYFSNYPYIEDHTDKYRFTIRRIDELVHLYISVIK